MKVRGVSRVNFGLRVFSNNPPAKYTKYNTYIRTCARIDDAAWCFEFLMNSVHKH